MKHKDLKVGMLLCPTEERVNGALELIIKSMDVGSDCRIIAAPEYLFENERPNIYSKDEALKIVDAIKEESKKYEHMLIVPGTITYKDKDNYYNNTAYAISNGKVLLKYAKKREAIMDTARMEVASALYRYHNKKSYFHWQELNIGIEICLDHATNIIESGILKTDRAQNLDVQILIACGMEERKESCALKKDGVFIRSDGKDKSCGYVLNYTGLSFRHIPKNQYELRYICEKKEISNRTEIQDNIYLKVCSLKLE